MLDPSRSSSPLKGYLKQSWTRLQSKARSAKRSGPPCGCLLLTLTPLISAGLIYGAVSAWRAKQPPPKRPIYSRLEQRYLQPLLDPSLGADVDALRSQLMSIGVPYWAAGNVSDDEGRLTPLVAPSLPRVDVPLTSPDWDKETQIEMRFNYLSEEKRVPMVGSPFYLHMFAPGSRKWFNSLAVVANADSPAVGSSTDYRLHGRLGLDIDGKTLWTPSPEPPSTDKYPGGVEAALKNGGFYLNKSNALPLDRFVPDNREPVCRSQHYDLHKLPDASVVITFYNEPLSTLLRTVHSVLNYSPPPLLREIILVDDHSNLTENLPGSVLDRYVAHLPKTKILRQPYRRGLVHARLAGARAATGAALIVLDSHIEVNVGWLEPQLARVAEQPNSVVFPQILAIDPETFKYDVHSGIGCKISFRWSMVEQSSMASKVTKPDPIPSPSMAGGLFAVSLDYFWHIGGYDEGFTMWGAENVEMGFRTWQCGGRLECVPCAKTYHIYRKKGHGYESPHDAIVSNRLRAARVWTDEYFAIAKLFIQGPREVQMGNLDNMLALKNRLQCRPFHWFLDEIDPNHDIQSLQSIEFHGEVQSLRPMRHKYCLDTMSHSQSGEEYNVFPCHGEGGTQNWVKLKEKSAIVPVTNERLCLSDTLKFVICKDVEPAKSQWSVIELGNDVVELQFQASKPPKCLSVEEIPKVHVAMKPCDKEDSSQHWNFHKFKPENVPPLTFSEDYQNRQGKYNAHKIE